MINFESPKYIDPGPGCLSRYHRHHHHPHLPDIPSAAKRECRATAWMDIGRTPGLNNHGQTTKVVEKTCIYIYSSQNLVSFFFPF